MEGEGYLKLKIRDMKEEVSNLQKEVENIREYVKTLKEISESTKQDIKDLENLKNQILNMDYVKYKDDLITEITYNLREINTEVIKSYFFKIKNVVLHKIDNNIVPSLNDLILQNSEKLMQLQSNHLEAVFCFFKEGLPNNMKKYFDFKLFHNKIMTDEEEALKFLRRQKQNEKRRPM